MMWLIVIIVIGYVYYSNKNGSSSFGIGNKNSDELLKERFVKGEIDESTYLQMKETLKK